MVFQPRHFFKAGLKIIGVLTIIWGITHIVPVVFEFFSVYNNSNIIEGNDLRYYRFSLVFQVVYPILLLVIGIYLLKSGESIMDWAFRDSEEKSDDGVAQLFFLFMKLAGLALIIYALPKAFQILSNVIFVTSTSTVGGSEQIKSIFHHLAATIINLLLGLYLLRSGKFFRKIGFPQRNDSDNDQES